MRRTLTIIGLAVAGIVLAVALSVGAFALVGDSLSEPATAIQVPASPTRARPKIARRPSATNRPSTPRDALGGPITERVPERRSPAAIAAPAEAENRSRATTTAGTAEDTAPTTDGRRSRWSGPERRSTPNVAEYGSMSDNLHRQDVWGDDPEERDASEVVAEIAAVDPESARRWHDHPAVVPFKAVGRFIGRNGQRIAITIAGVVVLLAGLALLVLPGPGWVLIFAGLAILATEYVWAARCSRAKEQGEQAKDKVLRRKQAKPPRDGTSADVRRVRAVDRLPRERPHPDRDVVAGPTRRW